MKSGEEYYYGETEYKKRSRDRSASEGCWYWQGIHVLALAIVSLLHDIIHSPFFHIFTYNSQLCICFLPFNITTPSNIVMFITDLIPTIFFEKGTSSRSMSTTSYIQCHCLLSSYFVQMYLPILPSRTHTAVKCVCEKSLCTSLRLLYLPPFLRHAGGMRTSYVLFLGTYPSSRTPWWSTWKSSNEEWVCTHHMGRRCLLILVHGYSKSKLLDILHITIWLCRTRLANKLGFS